MIYDFNQDVAKKIASFLMSGEYFCLEIQGDSVMISEITRIERPDDLDITELMTQRDW